jgi:hypothetical protein
MNKERYWYQIEFLDTEENGRKIIYYCFVVYNGDKKIGWCNTEKEVIDCVNGKKNAA